VRIVLPDERHDLATGDAVRFDAILHHTYEALENSQVIIAHLRKPKRFCRLPAWTRRCSPQD
jgi:hypothetical protein